ncbi:hypothetical protein D9M71_807710 [compost metagenome]
MRRVVRSNRRTPSSDSRCPTALVSAEGVFPSCSAARLKLPHSAVETNMVSALSLSIDLFRFGTKVVRKHSILPPGRLG